MVRQLERKNRSKVEGEEVVSAIVFLVIKNMSDMEAAWHEERKNKMFG